VGGSRQQHTHRAGAPEAHVTLARKPQRPKQTLDMQAAADTCAMCYSWGQKFEQSKGVGQLRRAVFGSR